MKIRVLHHPTPPSFPPTDHDPYADPPLERIKVGDFWVDYYPPGLPTQADVDEFRAPPDPATTPLNSEDIERLLKLAGISQAQIDQAKRDRGR